jgi:hypothetical protein
MGIKWGEYFSKKMLISCTSDFTESACILQTGHPGYGEGVGRIEKNGRICQPYVEGAFPLRE